MTHELSPLRRVSQIAPFLLLLFISTRFPAALATENGPDGPCLVTNGSARLEVPADMATFEINVTADARQALQAKHQVDTRVSQYMTLLHQKSVAEKDIAAANLTTRPRYRRQKDAPDHLDGFRAQRTLTITLRDLAKLDTLLDEALKLQLNDIRRITFGVSDPEHYRDTVRQQAVAQALKHAKALASGFGATLGPVWRIRYQSPAPTQVPSSLQLVIQPNNAATQAPDSGYQSHTLTFSDNVDVIFRLSP